MEQIKQDMQLIKRWCYKQFYNIGEIDDLIGYVLLKYAERLQKEGFPDEKGIRESYILRFSLHRALGYLRTLKHHASFENCSNLISHYDNHLLYPLPKTLTEKEKLTLEKLNEGYNLIEISKQRNVTKQAVHCMRNNAFKKITENLNAYHIILKGMRN